MCRYKKPADWELLSDLAEQHPVPLIGNGDVLTHYEVCSMGLGYQLTSDLLKHKDTSVGLAHHNV